VYTPFAEPSGGSRAASTAFCCAPLLGFAGPLPLWQVIFGVGRQPLCDGYQCAVVWLDC